MSVTVVDDALWSAIGDPTRRRLLDVLLSEGPGSATTLSAQLPVTRQAVTKHLSVLDRVGLVRPSSVAGREKRYEVDEAQLARAVAQLASVGALWDARLRRIKRLAEALERTTQNDNEIGGKNMVDILHRVGITAPPAKVYEALTTVDGLAGWWTTDTTGDAEGVLRFRFGTVGGFDMKVLDARPDERVCWEVCDGPAEWLGTTVTFDLSRHDDWTIVSFAHAGWREPVEFMHHCSTKWAIFLMSLKSLVETAAGAPHPRDVQISNWH